MEKMTDPNRLCIADLGVSGKATHKATTFKSVAMEFPSSLLLLALVDETGFQYDRIKLHIFLDSSHRRRFGLQL
jgi:hypothetical protein